MDEDGDWPGRLEAMAAGFGLAAGAWFLLMQFGMVVRLGPDPTADGRLVQESRVLAPEAHWVLFIGDGSCDCGQRAIETVGDARNPSKTTVVLIGNAQLPVGMGSVHAVKRVPADFTEEWPDHAGLDALVHVGDSSGREIVWSRNPVGFADRLEAAFRPHPVHEKPQ